MSKKPKFTDLETLQSIRYYYHETSMSMAAIATRFGCSPGLINTVIERRGAYSHLPPYVKTNDGEKAEIIQFSQDGIGFSTPCSSVAEAASRAFELAVSDHERNIPCDAPPNGMDELLKRTRLDLEASRPLEDLGIPQAIRIAYTAAWQAAQLDYELGLD